MDYMMKDPDKANDMDMMRRLITLEVELRMEREQHALAKQCINYMAHQLATQGPKYTQQALTEEIQHGGRRLDGSDYRSEHWARQEIEQRAESEGKSEQRIEPEDLLDRDDEQVQSMGPPTTLSSNTPPTPLSPGFDKGFRAECHAFLNRDQAGKLIDDSDQAEPTLFTFENSGAVENENLDPDVDNNAQDGPVQGRQRKESTQKPLSLENLSDRYKNNEPTIDGVDASKWAKAEMEKRAQVQEVAEDLMQFPADEEEFTEAELEEPEDTRSEEEIEAAKQKHAADIRKNQALVMYDPAPSEDSLRTMLVSEIPANMTMADITRIVCGGIIIKIQAMHTTPLTGNESMLITFLRAKDARNFLSSVKASSKPKFSLLETPTYPLNGILADDIMYNGVSRCLAIYDLHRDITLEMLCNALRPWASRDDRIVSVCRDGQGVCHVEFRSVLAALDGRFELRKLSRRFSRVEHGRDPCDGPVPGLVEDEALKEVGSDETRDDGEIRESKDQDEDEDEDEDENEGEGETTAGAVERDADGWPIGGLDY